MMYFPNYIKLRYKYATRETSVPHFKQALEYLQKNNAFSMIEPHLFFISEELRFDEVAKNAEYEVCINKELRETLQWISKRILTTLGIDNYLSTNVYIRIGTSMLNKLVEKNIISKEFGIYYHDNLVANLAACLSMMNTEELPF